MDLTPAVIHKALIGTLVEHVLLADYSEHLIQISLLSGVCSQLECVPFLAKEVISIRATVVILLSWNVHPVKSVLLVVLSVQRCCSTSSAMHVTLRNLDVC